MEIGLDKYPWLRVGLLCIALSLLPGCAAQHPVRPNTGTGTHSLTESMLNEPNYELQTLPELVGYAAYLAELPSFQRRAECEWLQRFNEISPNAAVQLHLALALLVVSDCGGNELQQAVDLFKTGIAQVQDLQARRFLSYHAIVAERLYSADRYNAELAHKLNQKWKQINENLTRRLRECNESLQDAQSKLEALKAIEQSLNPTEIP